MSTRKEINRRNFLSKLGIGAAGTFGSGLIESSSEIALNNQILPLSKVEKNLNTRDIKINMKPISCNMIHEGVWTGPCRWNPNPPPEEERVQAKEFLDENLRMYKNNLSKDAKLLEPAYFEYREATGVEEKHLRELEADNEEVDLYVVSGLGYPQYPGSLIGERYKKPVAVISGYIGWDLSARLRSKGLEGYAPVDIKELNDIISILRARKMFQQTNLLLISDTPFANRPVPSACTDFKGLNERFGIKTTILSYKEMTEERERIMKSSSMMEEVENLTDKLIRNAEEVRMERRLMIPSVVFYFTIKNLMNKYDCNAFTIECFEFCSSKLSHNWQAIPCLTHSLLKDEGYPSGCEGDINATLAMDMLIGVANRSAFFGNLCKKDENTMIFMGHNVPGIKMLGFDKPDLPYALQNFITAGWGAKVQMDLAQFDEKTITMAKFNPLITKVLLVKGEIVGSADFDIVGCKLKAHVRVPDIEGLVEKARNYGFHYPWVYGDYTKEVKKLADMLKLEVETHNA